MELLVEILFQVCAEGLLQLLGELGFRAFSEPFLPREKRSAPIAAVAYVAFGCMLGGLSLLIAPHSLIPKAEFRMLNLIVTPILVGLVMAGLGAVRRKKGEDVLRLDTFAYAYLFALGMTLVRWYWAS